MIQAAAQRELEVALRVRVERSESKLVALDEEKSRLASAVRAAESEAKLSAEMRDELEAELNSKAWNPDHIFTR